MRKVTAIFFLLIFATSTVHANELLKLPELVNHYVKHKTDVPTMSLLEFVSVHYMQGNIVDDDYTQDMQLPFKTMQCTANCIVLDLPEVPVDSIKELSYPIQKQFEAHCYQLYLTAFIANIWQPPRA